MELPSNILLEFLSIILNIFAIPGRAAWELMISGSASDFLIGLIVMVGVYGGIPLAGMRVAHRYL